MTIFLPAFFTQPLNNPPFNIFYDIFIQREKWNHVKIFWATISQCLLWACFSIIDMYWKNSLNMQNKNLNHNFSLYDKELCVKWNILLLSYFYRPPRSSNNLRRRKTFTIHTWIKAFVIKNDEIGYYEFENIILAPYECGNVCIKLLFYHFMHELKMGIVPLCCNSRESKK